VSNNEFILLLSFGALLLGGILAVAHLSAYRLNQRRQLRLPKQVLAPDPGSFLEPELDLGPDAPRFGGVRAGKNISVELRHAETAR
jgi:hypothetical protein